MNNNYKNCITGYLANIPFLITFFAIIIFYCPELNNFLQYNITAINNYELWRLITGHFTHWNFEHLFWDLLMFAIFGKLVYKNNPKAFMFIIIFTPLLTSVATIILNPSMHFYRGLSGIDTALFAYAAIAINQAYRRKYREMLTIKPTCGIKRNKYKWQLIEAIPIGMLILLILKTCFELYTGTNLFVSSKTFSPAPLAHLAGLFTGLIISFKSCLHSDNS